MARKQSGDKASTIAGEVQRDLRTFVRFKGTPVVGPAKPSGRYVLMLRSTAGTLSGSVLSQDETKGNRRKTRKRRARR